MGYKAPKAVAPVYAGYQTNTSANNIPVPWLRGTNVVAPNIIWYDNFKKHQQSGGGKGGGKGSGKSGGSSPTYTADVLLSLCGGPINDVGTIFVNKSSITLAKEGWTLFKGASPQPVWGYLTAKPRRE